VFLPKSKHRLLDGLSASTFKAIAILVKFSDKPSHVSPVSFDSLLYGINGHTLRNYYNEVSRGTLDIVTVNFPSTLGWMDVPQPYSYYVNGEKGFGSYPNNAQKLAEDAIAAANSVVDFSQYDNDGDGYVDGLFIIHAGPGYEFTGNYDDIHSHAWSTSTPQLVDGVYASGYSMEPEYWQSPGDMTCGVYAHEAGHAIFGLPDLYDYGYDSEGLGAWSLMAGGSWNGPLGSSPAHPDAWSLYQMGFATRVNIISDAVAVNIPAVQDSVKIFRLWKNGTGSSEYFLVENRQLSGYDTYLPGDGLLIYHIDESQYGNNNQWYPGHTSTGNYKVALEQADGLWQLERNQSSGDENDPYPGLTNNRSFDNSSTPNSKTYYGVRTYVGVTNISSSASTMTADFTVNVVPPEIDITPLSFAVTVAAGDTAQRILTIRNAGPGDLDFEIIEPSGPPPPPPAALQNATQNFKSRESSNNQKNQNAAGFLLDQNWVSFDPTSGTVAAADSQLVTLTFNPNGINPGFYNGNLYVANNDLNESSVPLSVSFTILDQPNISVTQDSIDFDSLFVNHTHSETLNIGNRGSRELVCNNISTSNPDFILDRTTLSVPPDSERFVVITFTPTSAGDFIGALTIKNNDPGDSVVNVLIKAKGVHPPHISVPSDTVTLTLHRGQSGSTQYRISNTGLGNLFYNITYQPDHNEIGDTSTTLAGKTTLRGNIWTVKEPLMLREIKFFLNILKSTEIQYAVYESNSKTGPFYRIFMKPVLNSGIGRKFYSSDSMALPMNPVKYYFIGLTSKDSITFYRQPKTLPFENKWGRVYSSGLYYYSPPPLLISPTLSTTSVIYQSLGFSEEIITSIIPENGMVNPGSFTDIEINMKAEGRIGSHYIFLNINNNDPLLPSVPIPLKLTIQFSGVSVCDGWNLVSVPLIVDDCRKSSLFPTSGSDAFTYSSSYLQQDSLRKGNGYWMKFNSDQTVDIPGTEILCDTINVNPHWNIIGSLSYPVLVSQVTPITPLTISNVIGYSNLGGYFNADTLEPGCGYWIKTDRAGRLVLNSSYAIGQFFKTAGEKNITIPHSVMTSEIADKEGISSLTFIDGQGKKQSLYFTSKHKQIQIESFELPPSPPQQTFDVRFASQRNIEAENGKDQAFPILINGGKFPLTLSRDIKEQIVYPSIQVDDKTIQLNGNRIIEIGNPKAEIKLRLSGSSLMEIPKEFALQQNYPNPFNPSTLIRYQLPVDSKVTLKVFNILGQEVSTLVDEVQDAGYKSVEWNPSTSSGQSLASGVYLYQLNAVSIADVNKSLTRVNRMLLLK
jgi:immune inhibitor A